jgi:hypothetical protein
MLRIAPTGIYGFGLVSRDEISLPMALFWVLFRRRDAAGRNGEVAGLFVVTHRT